MTAKSCSGESDKILIGLLTIVFVTLKLLGVIGWSWWWVLSPMWITVALALLLMLGAWVYVEIEDRWRRR